MAVYRLSVIVLQLPTIAVLVAGIALLVTRRATLPPRSVQLGVGGCVALLVGALGGLGWSFAVPLLVSQAGMNFTDFGLLSVVVGGVLTLLYAAGLGLLIAAVLGGVRATPPPTPAAAPPPA